MKLQFLFYMSILLASCTTVKQVINQKIVSEPATSGFRLENNRMLLDVGIEGKNHVFLFDSGAMVSFIIDSTIVDNFSTKEFSTIGSAKSANGEVVKTATFAVAVKHPLFESEHKMMRFSPMQMSKCSVPYNFKGIIGLDVFFQQDYPLMLDFTNGKMSNLTTAGVSNYLNNGFRQVKSKCSNGKIFIFPEIDGKPYQFKLDTGYNGTMNAPASAAINLKRFNVMELEGTLFQTATGSSDGSESLYEKVPVVLEGKKFETKINVSTSIAVQNVGIAFMKGFDWIIDYNHNKIYVKRNHTKIENTFNRKIQYLAKVVEQLKINLKEKHQTKYNLGDEIISVDGQKVTAENRCELQDFLNRAEDWSAINLVVIPAVK